MAHRDFDPARDAPAVLRQGWLRHGERHVWLFCGPGSFRYKVSRRTGDGTLIRHPFWWALGWTLIYPFWLVSEIYYALIGGFFDPEPPSPVVFGSHWDCLSARLADAREFRTFWVLTDQRFTLVSADPLSGPIHSTMDQLAAAARGLGQFVTGADRALPPEPVRLRVVWELRIGQYAFQGVVKRWRTEYDRVTFPDGSGIDFPR